MIDTGPDGYILALDIIKKNISVQNFRSTSNAIR